MERRDNLFENFSTARTEVALLEGVMDERDEIKTPKDKLGLRLKKSHIKIKLLRRQIEFYKVAHSKLKNIFLSGLEVFKQVDFGSNASVELNKFSLEVLQKHFLEHADKVGSLCEIPTERQLERYIFQKSKKFLEDSKTRRGNSGSEDGSPDDTNLEFGTSWNPDELDRGSDEELLPDSGLESVKEEMGASEFDLSDGQFVEDFSLSTEFTAGVTNKGRSEVVKSRSQRNLTVTQNIAIPSTGESRTENGSFVSVNPEVVMLDENQLNPVAKVENPAGNQNPQGRNVREGLHEKNCQRNEPARGIYNSTILDVTPRPETPVPVVFNHSRELYDSSVLEKGLINSSREKQYQGEMGRCETYTSEPGCRNTPVTATKDDMTSTIMNRGSRSPVFKGCNPRRRSGGHIEVFTRNCSTPFRQLNENFGRTWVNFRGYSRTSSAKEKMFSRRSMYTKPRQEENGPSGARKLRQTLLNMERFKGNNLEQGMRSEDRENESFARDRLSDHSRYENTSEDDDDDDDDDDIIYGSPGKVNQMYLNPRRQKVRRDYQQILQKSATPDLDETFISSTVVRNYQMSRGLGPPLHLPPGHPTTREVSPEYDSVPFAYQRGPVRKRAERMKLPGQACAECDKYYNNVYGDANTSDYNRMLNKCSRHRNAGGQDDTPPGYWTPFLTGNEEV